VVKRLFAVLLSCVLFCSQALALSKEERARLDDFAQKTLEKPYDLERILIGRSVKFYVNSL